MAWADAGSRAPGRGGFDQEDATEQARMERVLRKGVGGGWPCCPLDQGHQWQQAADPLAVDGVIPLSAHTAERLPQRLPYIFRGEGSTVQRNACVRQRMSRLQMHRGKHPPRPDALLHDSHRLPLVNPLSPNHYTAP